MFDLNEMNKNWNRLHLYFIHYNLLNWIFNVLLTVNFGISEKQE